MEKYEKIEKVGEGGIHSFLFVVVLSLINIVYSRYLRRRLQSQRVEPP